MWKAKAAWQEISLRTVLSKGGLFYFSVFSEAKGGSGTLGTDTAS